MLNFSDWLREHVGLHSVPDMAQNGEEYQRRGVQSKYLATVAKPAGVNRVDANAMFLGEKARKKKSRRSK